VIKLDSMLMIGSASSNVGKTELACDLIKKFRRDRDIVGVKVTTIEAKDGRCPRGGQGCGVCSSLQGDYCITEETDRNSHKDTARLLAAGAKRVFWIRAMRSHLAESITALLGTIDSEAALVCESNSLRLVVEPGVFLMVENGNSAKGKKSALRVKEYPDAVVASNGKGFDLDLERIAFVDGRWILQEKATAIILAGGMSGRMGTDKRMLPVRGGPMIEHICRQLGGTFDEILVSGNDPEKLDFLGVKVVPDEVTGQGPLMGIASALRASANELNFVVACDIVQIELPLVRRMLAKSRDCDLVIPTTGDGKYEPLFAVYRKSALPAIDEVLRTGRRKISDVFARCRVKHIELGIELMNLNTMQEYERFQQSHNDEFR
jgi:molybdopterin-guanine dinucleotide biosynthesis protein A